jgi:hypothetical protein
MCSDRVRLWRQNFRAGLPDRQQPDHRRDQPADRNGLRMVAPMLRNNHGLSLLLPVIKDFPDHPHDCTPVLRFILLGSPRRKNLGTSG